MDVELIGMVSASEWPPHTLVQPDETSDGSPLHPDHLHRMALAYEQAGFDGVLVRSGPAAPDGVVVADQVLSVTRRLRVMVALPAGWVAPTVAARQFATLAALHRGRVSLHLVVADNSLGPGGDGDVSDHGDRYRRADEFLEVLEAEWLSPDRFTFAGQFYEVAGAWSSVRPEGGHLPISVGGSTPEAIRLAVRHADVFALGAQPLRGLTDRMAEVRAVAREEGQDAPRFSVNLRLAVAATGTEARRRADDLGAAAEGETPAVMIVGTPPEVASHVLDYVAAGVSTFVLCGHGTYAESAEQHRVIGLVRDQLGSSSSPGPHSDRR